MDYSNEEWKPVVGFENYYQVSTFGRVRRAVDGLRRSIKAGFLLSQNITESGYFFVALYDRDKRSTSSKLVHNLFTSAFLGPKPKGFQVNHKDGLKANNALSNLEYVTGGDNQRHAYCMGLMKKKLNPQLVRKIRELEGTLSSSKIGKLFGVSKITVQRIHRRIYWKTVE